VGSSTGGTSFTPAAGGEGQRAGNIRLLSMVPLDSSITLLSDGGPGGPGQQGGKGGTGVAGSAGGDNLACNENFYATGSVCGNTGQLTEKFYWGES
jgi:hypothetical protein